MIFKHHTRTALAAALFGLGLCALPSTPVHAAGSAVQAAPQVQITNDGVDVHLGKDLIALRLVRDNVLNVHVEPNGKTSAPALVMAPDAPHRAQGKLSVKREGGVIVMSSDALHVQLDPATLALTVSDGAHPKRLLSQTSLRALSTGQLSLHYAKDAPMYGIRGYAAVGSSLYDTPDCAYADHDPSGLLREGRQVAKACPQGAAGGPFAWSTGGFGVLVDTKTATFDIADGTVSVSHTSRPDLSYYLIAGRPHAIFDAVADLTGHAPLFPKWAMGFTNSQWGIDQKELLDIVHTYRRKHIPIDNFTLDFDWKAWGQDHYGEFRWNPKKFPDGPSGKLARQLRQQGMHLTGIMKPRIHVDTVEGRYATEHHLWVPGEKVSDDYFSHKPVKDVDFDTAAARHWFGQLAVTYGFDKGMVGWWNDEADEIDDNTQFLNMQRSLYDAQRKHTDVRVWSINRNFWLGSQRYAYGVWSGDIKTGFKAMARQRLRMLNAISSGAMQWGMDGGGFQGHPSDQNYARWIEFGAFTPIFRVHGTQNEKRQPWRYGPVAEKAATAAIRLRYKLLPYIYSYAWNDHAHGVGLVRPLTFAWPHDPKVRNDVNAWMFGDWMLVSPVVQKDQTHKSIYLPAGTWTDYFNGKVYQGGQTITVATDAKTWRDIPLFVREGAIIPTQPVMDYVGQHPVPTLSVDMFPARKASHFNYYDDNGKTYAYEHGAYFLQGLDTQRDGRQVHVRTEAVQGSYAPALKHYLMKVHGLAAHQVGAKAGALKQFDSLKALKAAGGQGWARGHDRFGPVTYVKLDAGQVRTVTLK
ncbi:TIM-barrel domain-containing protein [Oleiagrimonas sp. C23AA]|uniref:TIM-barrel domain-containing protein n=1 Tax=Oleiagrimonas sp. C23AA TaxID=2719047 RepID=UPI0014210D7E|nr:TIM-barrel domain-containing protein [Oleiagrimonas sp. C23AA]NII11219.1 DUF5110 domain-containing protein [Oleiagrimonas sp. C23AA]